VASVGNIARGQIHLCDDSFECSDSRVSPRMRPSTVIARCHLRRADEHRRGKRRHEVSDLRKYLAGPDGCEKRPSTCATTSLFANTATRSHIPFRLHVLVEPRDSVYYYYYHRRRRLSFSLFLSHHRFSPLVRL
ncbi:hypothetical protein ALC60_05286, partial [Trachymyrmex zeteki]